MKRYRVYPIGPTRFDVEVWVGWRLFGSWEPAREYDGKNASYETTELAERFIQLKREEEERFKRERQAANAELIEQVKFQFSNPPYEFPKEDIK